MESFDNKLCLLDFRYIRLRSTVDNRINAEYLEQDNNVLIETKKQIDVLLSQKKIVEFIGNKNKKIDFKFVTAVKTTGIFCLPSCRAKKPNKENVIFYDIKKEAIKNGYRACKVCKP